MSSSRQYSHSPRKSKANSKKKMLTFMANQIARIVPKIVSEIQASSTPNHSGDSHVVQPKPVSFNYKHFTACNPKTFTGKDGVTAMLEWFDSMEVTFINSECPEELKVRSATGVFQARALDWWTNERNIRSNELAYALSWEELRQHMMEEFCPPHEQQKLEEEFWTLKQVGDENLAYTTRFKQLCFIVPHLVLTTERTIRKYINGLPPMMRDTIEAARLDNIEDVYRLAASLNNNRVRDKQVAAASKPTSSSKPAHQITHNNRGKKRAHQSSVCNAVTPVENPKPNPANPEKKQYTGTNPKCTTCHFHHPTTSPCRHCTSCNRYGHLAAYCRNNPTTAQNSKPANVVRACFKCGDPTHLRPQCPQLRQDLQQKAPQGRAFVINAQQARNDNEVVNGTFLVK
ncbi:uncharacterized protein LOC110891561 [Helianthus annuus]|uniref:uncharacterized protein LOC110891561 n=1 Tax=Helianthus annuus TaxID=4232 RepID=UPI000B8F2F9F|nr:uncharacterized protein LOC110891561 [Helianthus annuus]